MEYKTDYEGPWMGINAHCKLVLKVNEWRYQQPVVVIDKCSHCGTCEIFCPTGCIISHETHCVADLTHCKGCGVCARECPSNVIKMVPEGNE